MKKQISKSTISLAYLRGEKIISKKRNRSRILDCQIEDIEDIDKNENT
jgi:hypothetical protein